METKRALDEALKMLGMIALKGDAVDVMAAAKGNIRAAIAQIELDKENTWGAAWEKDVKSDG